MPQRKKRSAKAREAEPKVAPGMMMNDPLEEKATEAEIRRGDYTSVTRLYIDRTPDR